jgi:protease-4
MTGTAARVGQAVAVAFAAVLALAIGWVVFVVYPADLVQLLGLLVAIGFALGVARLAGRVAASVLPDYNVAEVAIEGPITRDGGGGLASRSMGADADDLVEQIEAADADRGADALLVKLNTPGGEIVPSQDIRNAVEGFDGPTVAYATDLCASGGYDIASGCDEFWAREGSIVGSIGVIGSRVTAGELADRLGIEYESLTAGEYKDAGVPFEDLEDDERAYLQRIVDDYYDQFVESVVERRDLDTDAVRDTEAKVYLGESAAELDLVDELGTREAVEDRLADRLGESVEIERFEPRRGLSDRIQVGAQRVAFAGAAGIAGTLRGDIDGVAFRR